MVKVILSYAHVPRIMRRLGLSTTDIPISYIHRISHVWNNTPGCIGVDHWGVDGSKFGLVFDDEFDAMRLVFMLGDLVQDTKLYGKSEGTDDAH